MTKENKIKLILVLLLAILVLLAYMILNPSYTKKLQELGYSDTEIETLKELDLLFEAEENADSALFRYALESGTLTKENLHYFTLADSDLPQDYTTESYYSTLTSFIAKGYNEEEVHKIFSSFSKTDTQKLLEMDKADLQLIKDSLEKGYSMELILNTIAEGNEDYLKEDIDIGFLSTMAEKGYSMDDIHQLYDAVSEEDRETLYAMKYIENLGAYYTQDGFNYDLLPRYIIAVEQNGRSIAEAVSLVNENGDYIPDAQLDWSAMYNKDTEEAVSDPDNLLVLVNKQHYLSEEYEPADLVYLPEGYYGNYHPMRKEAADALVEMSNAAVAMGYAKIYGQSNYRSYAKQVTLYNNYVSKNGVAAADRYSARAGYSEHQTGLVADLGGGVFDMLDFEYYSGYKWTVENAYKYGFIQRYPEGKEFITGYEFESWHFRYVGIDAATVMHEHNWTLEEYLTLFEN